MRTTLFRLLPAAALAVPLLALAAFAQDQPAHRCAAAGTMPAAAAPQAPIQQIPHTQPQVPDFPNGPPEGPPPYVGVQQYIVPPAAPAAPTLADMVKELKELREREKKLTEAIRQKVKDQRKALDDAEREVGGEGQCGPYPPSLMFSW
jgi:hypothetical protein